MQWIARCSETGAARPLEVRSPILNSAAISAATATLPAPVKKPRRRKIAAIPAALSFPIPAHGGTALAGYGNWDTYLMLDEAIGSRGVRARYNEEVIEVRSISPLHEKLKARLGHFLS